MNPEIEKLLEQVAAFPALDETEWKAYLRVKYTDYPPTPFGAYIFQGDVALLKRTCGL